MFCRSSTKALRQSRCFSTTATRQADFTHAVIGGGAVGLAIARKLQQRDGVSTVLIEKHGMVGSETSSRNSEASINAGENTRGIALTKNRSYTPDCTTQKTVSRRGYASKARR
jgi:glycine/D-amino acid oxidase-like deaminating enzyme